MPSTPPLAGWTVVSLRPQNRHDAVRRAAAAQGARVLAASPFRLRATADRAALDAVLACPIRIASSPEAVRFAAALRPLRGAWWAVGHGTARALRAAGATRVEIAEPQNADGLLALPSLRDLRGTSVGLVTAPDGRGLMERELPARGARLRIAHVYVREPVPLTPARLQALAALGARSALLVSSQAAFGQFWRQLDEKKRDTWRGRPCIASSARLLQYLRQQGFRQLAQADSTHAPAMLAALAACAGKDRTRSRP
ncbi:MAG: uroporphyrinogen-III synthase [Arenimonas sp.]